MRLFPPCQATISLLLLHRPHITVSGVIVVIHSKDVNKPYERREELLFKLNCKLRSEMNKDSKAFFCSASKLGECSPQPHEGEAEEQFHSDFEKRLGPCCDSTASGPEQVSGASTEDGAPVGLYGHSCDKQGQTQTGFL